ncbi:MAG: dinitrogenase iron-molybdenum cofactor biosynthesis protein [Planctomycetota bacterium]|nr:MAG: dinitrogenase iron-molybdenum cofactor biosynthesis protein [Planctomycetota bacterium]
MLVVVTSQGDTLDSQVDGRFGRCAWFLFYDTEKDELVEAVQNAAAAAGGGAGIQAAQFVVNKGAKAVITGNVGPNASAVLQGAGVEIYVGASGTVKDAIEAFKAGKLTKASGPTVGAFAGAGQGAGAPQQTPPPQAPFYAPGPGFGRGMGWGRGMGFGRGMGWGRGRGRGWGPPANCVCPSCGTTVPHTPGVPCRSMRCPQCGLPMMRGD